jgi:phosphodiesterase/alkaline phosphatase D-like protein
VADGQTADYYSSHYANFQWVSSGQLTTNHSFSYNVSGLASNTTYYYREEIFDSGFNFIFSNETSFTTNIPYPSVSSSAATNITNTSARLNGTITDDGGSTCSVSWGYGTVSHTSADFASYTTVTSFSGSYTTSQTPYKDVSLSANTTYYFRIQAQNAYGTATSDERTFHTDTNPSSISIVAASSITSTTATINGYITDSGGSNVAVSWGYGTVSHTLVTDYTTVTGWVGSYGNSSSPYLDITGLTPSTQYYFRFQIQDSGTTTSGELYFTTLGAWATVSTTAVTSLTSTTVTLNGLVNSDGGYPTGVSVKWGYGTVSQTYATFASYTTVEDSFSGTYSSNSTFTKNLTGLTAGTIYYYMVRAHTSTGDSYSAQGSFTTLNTASLTSVAASSVAQTTARLNGTIINDGGAVCTVSWGYGTTSHTAGDFASYTHVTSPMGVYTSGQNPYLDVTGLTAGGTYYFRFKATNTVGSTTSGELTFITTVGVGDPSNLIGIPTAATIALSWTAGAGDSSYLVRVGDSTYPTTITDGALVYQGASPKYTQTGLISGKTYYYSVWGKSGTTYSTGYATNAVTINASIISTTSSGAVLTTPWRWMSAPNYHNLENIPMAYDAVNGVADSLNIPRETFWMFLAMFTSAIGGVMAYSGAGASGRGQNSQIIGLLVGLGLLTLWWGVQIVPWYILLLYIMIVIATLRASREMA